MTTSIKQLIFLSIAVLGAFASPPPRYGQPNRCLSDADAKQVATLWTQLIGNFTTKLADAALTPDYTDYSASALSLNSNCQQAPGQAPPLTEPVFTNRSSFEMGQGSQAPIASTILNVWHSCTTVTMRYRMTNIGTATRPVTGIIVMETVKAPPKNTYPNQIKITYSEFDSAAWVSNLKDAGTCKNPVTGKFS